MVELNIDIEKAALKMAKETHSGPSMAWTMAEQLKTYHPALFPIIEAWVAGEEREFEFQGITITYIMEKQRCCYIAAVSRMSTLLKNPESVERYKKRKFGWK